MSDSRVSLAEHKHGAVGEDRPGVGLVQVVQDPLLVRHWHGLTVYTVHCHQNKSNPKKTSHTTCIASWSLMQLYNSRFESFLELS